MKKIISSIFILLPILILSACQTNVKYDIIVTDFVAYDFTKAIVGDRLSIKLLTPVGSDYHNFEPTSLDLVDLKQTDIFIYLSMELNPWLGNEENLNNLLNDHASSIELEKLFDWDHLESDSHDQSDTHGIHFWTDPLIAIEIIESLTQRLITIYPSFETEFVSRSLSYQNQISDVTNLLETFISSMSNKDIYYVGHNALGPFETHFSLNIHALEESINPGADVTSVQITAFINELKSNDVKYLFVEEVNSLETANYIKFVVGNINILDLHGYHTVSISDWNNNVTYYDLLSRNYENIKEALTNG